MAGSVDTSIAQMQQATADNARLMTASMVASTSTQGATSATHTVNATSAAGGEVAKTTANDIRQMAKSS